MKIRARVLILFVTAALCARPAPPANAAAQAQGPLVAAAVPAAAAPPALPAPPAAAAAAAHPAAAGGGDNDRDNGDSDSSDTSDASDASDSNDDSDSNDRNDGNDNHHDNDGDSDNGDSDSNDRSDSSNDRNDSHRDNDDNSAYRGRQIVSLGHNSTLGPGEAADEVVSVFGSSSSSGDVRHDVVSVFGDTHLSGTAGGSAVAVLGSVYVDGEVDHDVVAVLGNVRLGAHAHVHGQVVEILGTLQRDPGAIVDGGTQRVLPGSFHGGHGLRIWLGSAALLGRPLMLGHGLVWMWSFALTFFLIYLLLALLFRDAVDRCVLTLTTHPGHSFLTAVLAVFLTPLLMFLLLVTIIGIPAIPLTAIAIFCAALFGKTVALAWIGYRCTGVGRAGGSRPHAALAVFIGGLIAMAAYLVPLLGFVVFVALGTFGYGAVLYTMLVRLRRPAAAGVDGGPGARAGAPPAAAGGAAAQGAAQRPAAGPGAGADSRPFHADAGIDAGAGAGAGAGADSRPFHADAGIDAGAGARAGAGAGTGAGAGAATPLSILPRAGFWIRMLALLIDAALVGLLLALLLGWYGGVPARLQLVGLAVYGAVMWKLKATTIGGIVCDLKVARLDGREIDWPTATVRALGCLLSLLVVGLGFLWIVFDPGRQAWHDKLAGTVVVRVPRGATLL